MKQLISLVLLGAIALGGIGVTQASQDHERHERDRYEERYRDSDDAYEHEQARHEYRHEAREYQDHEKPVDRTMNKPGRAARQ